LRLIASTSIFHPQQKRPGNYIRQHIVQDRSKLYQRIKEENLSSFFFTLTINGGKVATIIPAIGIKEEKNVSVLKNPTLDIFNASSPNVVKMQFTNASSPWTSKLCPTKLPNLDKLCVGYNQI